MSIWQYMRQAMHTLFSWNIFNLMIGAWLATRGKFWQGFASQNIGWAGINLGIAIFASISTDRRIKKMPDPLDPAVTTKEKRNFQRILWINTGLDVLYMWGGWRFAREQGRKDQRLRGVGYGIVLQGLLLFWFDLIQVLRLPRKVR